MANILIHIFDWLKAFHLISAFAWMAGIFYLPRLFIRHTERGEDNPEIARLFCLMERKLFRIIMVPAMLSVWAFGLLMLASGRVNIYSPSFIVKLLAVLAMTGFHFWCRARLNELARGEYHYSARALRIANEVPTLLLILAVVMVVVRPLG